MRILKVFNNSVVLARDEDGGAIVLLGRGVGFRTSPGSLVDEGKVTHRFVAGPGQGADFLSAFIAAIPPEHIEIASDIVDLARDQLGIVLSQSVIIPLADHIAFAIKRFRDGTALEYPLAAEVRYVYPREVEVALAAVELIRKRTFVDIPDDEAVPITLHFVNATSTNQDMSRTFEMTALLKDIFVEIESAYQTRLDPRGIESARFVTHLRYFLARVHQRSQLLELPGELTSSIRNTYTQAHSCAEKVAVIIEQALKHPVSPDELMYLTLHIARLNAERGSSPDPVQEMG